MDAVQEELPEERNVFEEVLLSYDTELDVDDFEAQFGDHLLELGCGAAIKFHKVLGIGGTYLAFVRIQSIGDRA